MYSRGNMKPQTGGVSCGIYFFLWFAPLAFFWGWYGLSAYDINMGMVFFSRDLHDAVFASLRKYPRCFAPDKIPPMIAGASIVDSAIIGAIAAFRWRVESWFPQARAWVVEQYTQTTSAPSRCHDPGIPLKTKLRPVLLRSS